MSADTMGPSDAKALIPELSHRTIWRFFYPLALSWVFMSIEGPVSVALISRLPNAEIGTAAFQVLMGLALWIESPVIDLLATSTTLARTRRDFASISRFTWLLIGWVTVAHALLVFTPLYGVVTGTILGVPAEVAAEARAGLAVMLPWSGAIGWRRYRQGILIRNGRTKPIGVGTFIRVVAMVAAALILYWSTRLPSIQIAGIALIAAVMSEAVFVHIASLGTIRRAFAEDEPESQPISTAKLLRFHLPLSGTTMVVMLSSPIVSWALSRTHDSIAQLAAFQVASSLVWFMRTTTYALPEVVITLYRDDKSAQVLRSFCVRVGLVASGTMLALWILHLDTLFFTRALGASPEISDLAHLGFVIVILIPLVNALQSYVRGMLTAHHMTVSRLLAIGVSVIVLFGTLAIGTATRLPGVVSVGICLTIAAVAEFGVLLSSWRSRRSKVLGPAAG